MDVKNCIHGVSIGENGNLIIDNFLSENSETSLTIKDGSELFIKNAKMNNIDYCFKVYRKSNMFNYSKINYQYASVFCNANIKEFSKDELSIINKIF